MSFKGPGQAMPKGHGGWGGFDAAGSAADDSRAAGSAVRGTRMEPPPQVMVEAGCRKELELPIDDLKEGSFCDLNLKQQKAQSTPVFELGGLKYILTAEKHKRLREPGEFSPTENSAYVFDVAMFLYCLNIRKGAYKDKYAPKPGLAKFGQAVAVEGGAGEPSKRAKVERVPEAIKMTTNCIVFHIESGALKESVEVTFDPPVPNSPHDPHDPNQPCYYDGSYYGGLGQYVLCAHTPSTPTPEVMASCQVEIEKLQRARLTLEEHNLDTTNVRDKIEELEARVTSPNVIIGVTFKDPLPIPLFR